MLAVGLGLTVAQIVAPLRNSCLPFLQLMIAFRKAYPYSRYRHRSALTSGPIARGAWVSKDQVINCWPLKDLKAFLAKKR